MMLEGKEVVALPGFFADPGLGVFGVDDVLLFIVLPTVISLAASGSSNFLGGSSQEKQAKEQAAAIIETARRQTALINEQARASQYQTTDFLKKITPVMAGILGVSVLYVITK